MAHLEAGSTSRVQDGSTWGAMAVVIALHALLLAWIMMSHTAAPMRQAVSRMVLVELRDATVPSPLPAITSQGAHGQMSPKAASLPLPSRRHAAPAERVSDRPRPESESRVMTPEGSERPADAAAAESGGVVVATVGTSAGTRTGANIPGGGGHRVHARFRPPEVRRRYLADYPLDAFEDHKEGTVDVMVTIGVDNSVKEAHVYQSSGTPSLDEAAVESVRQYVFRAARRGDEPTQAQAIVSIDWKIGPSTESHVAMRRENAKYPASAKEVTRQRNCILVESHDELCRSTTSSIEDRLRRGKKD